MLQWGSPVFWYLALGGRSRGIFLLEGESQQWESGWGTDSEWADLHLESIVPGKWLLSLGFASPVKAQSLPVNEAPAVRASRI